MMILPTLSLAFSLGEVDLTSHLGEPLKARVNINDTDTSIDASCFTVADISEVQAFRKASATLSQVGSNLTLVITTNQIIAEPIVNLSVTYQCEPRVNREYVLLLDPAPMVETNKANSASPSMDENLTSNTRQNPPANNSPLASTENKQAVTEDVIASAVEPPIKKPRAKKKKVKKTTVSMDEQLVAAYTGTPQSQPANASDPSINKPSASTNSRPATPDQPYLVISGGSDNASENSKPSNLALRLDTELDLNRVEISAAPLSNTETMDEVTVMANRLAHLEKQILSLQSKNQQLQAEAATEKAKNDSFLISPFFAKWLPYFGLGALLLILLAGLEAWRRKRLRERLDRHEAVWFDAEADDDMDTGLTLTSDSPRVEPKFSPDPLFGESVSQQSTVLTDADSEEADGVLEHAEVFIAHGRTVLAIQLLQNHLVDFPTQSPHVWLKLLSLLANEGLETEYDVAVIECNQFFNIKLPSFADANTTDHSSIEDHPHIVDRLEGAWGSAFAITLLNDLIYNQHLQPREGFARGTFEELFFLKKIAEILQSSNTLDPRAHLNKSQPGNAAVIASAAAIAAAEDAMQLETATPERFTAGDRNDDNNVHFLEASTGTNLQAVEDPQVEQVFDIGMPIDRDLADDPITDFITRNPDDFQVSEIDFALPAEEEDALEDEDMAPTIQNLEDITFVGDFPEALEFDQEDLATEPEAAESDNNKDSNVIEFDWDLPKIHKD